MEKIASVKKNNTWALAKCSKVNKPYGVKWVYKLKKESIGGSGEAQS